MFSKSDAPQENDLLHSSAAAFEVRHDSKPEIEGFTRRCGRRSPADKRPCMYMFGHDGRHTWEHADETRSAVT